MSVDRLAVLGGRPEFCSALHVGRPNVGDRAQFLRTVEEILDRVWFTNHGPVVQRFEVALQERLGVEHAVAVCNATQGLSVVAQALGITRTAIVPSFTFVATAHALRWQGVQPRFADIDPTTHGIDPESVAASMDDDVQAIVGVHTWGIPCATDALDEIARAQNIPVIYDAAHAFGCTSGGQPIGSNGIAEVFSFHATKYVNAFEGGAITTNDGDLAARLRLMINFGFDGLDSVACLGTNAKMSEVHAAMALASMAGEASFAAHNREIWEAYRSGLGPLQGLDLLPYPIEEHNAHQYVVVTVEPDAPLTRDELMFALHAEGCLARRYFSPGIHRMPPYREEAGALVSVPVTEEVSERVLILPTGTAMTPESARTVCRLLGAATDQVPAVRAALATGG